MKLDMKSRFAEEQTIGSLREADAGIPVKEACRRHEFSEVGYYLWRGKIGAMSVPDAKRSKELEAESGRLLRLPAAAILERDMTREVLRKEWQPRRLDVRWCG